jgi:hypothetical protein
MILVVGPYAFTMFQVLCISTFGSQFSIAHAQTFCPCRVDDQAKKGRPGCDAFRSASELFYMLGCMFSVLYVLSFLNSYGLCSEFSKFS